MSDELKTDYFEAISDFKSSDSAFGFSPVLDLLAAVRLSPKLAEKAWRDWCATAEPDPIENLEFLAKWITKNNFGIPKRVNDESKADQSDKNGTSIDDNLRPIVDALVAMDAGIPESQGRYKFFRPAMDVADVLDDLFTKRDDNPAVRIDQYHAAIMKEYGLSLAEKKDDIPDNINELLLQIIDFEISRLEQVSSSEAPPHKNPELFRWLMLEEDIPTALIDETRNIAFVIFECLAEYPGLQRLAIVQVTDWLNDLLWEESQNFSEENLRSILALVSLLFQLPIQGIGNFDDDGFYQLLEKFSLYSTYSELKTRERTELVAWEAKRKETAKKRARKKKTSIRRKRYEIPVVSKETAVGLHYILGALYAEQDCTVNLHDDNHQYAEYGWLIQNGLERHYESIQRLVDSPRSNTISVDFLQEILDIYYYVGNFFEYGADPTDLFEYGWAYAFASTMPVPYSRDICPLSIRPLGYDGNDQFGAELRWKHYRQYHELLLECGWEDLAVCYLSMFFVIQPVAGNGRLHADWNDLRATVNAAMQRDGADYLRSSLRVAYTLATHFHADLDVLCLEAILKGLSQPDGVTEFRQTPETSRKTSIEARLRAELEPERWLKLCPESRTALIDAEQRWALTSHEFGRGISDWGGVAVDLVKAIEIELLNRLSSVIELDSFRQWAEIEGPPTLGKMLQLLKKFETLPNELQKAIDASPQKIHHEPHLIQDLQAKGCTRNLGAHTAKLRVKEYAGLREALFQHKLLEKFVNALI